MKTLRRGCWPLDAQSGLSWIVRASDARTATALPWWPAGTSTVVRRPRSTAPELNRRHARVSPRTQTPVGAATCPTRRSGFSGGSGVSGTPKGYTVLLLRGQRPRGRLGDDRSVPGPAMTQPTTARCHIPDRRKSTLRMVFVRLFPSCRDAQAPLSLLARRLCKSRDGRPGRKDKPSGAPRVDQADRSAGRCDGGAGRDSSSAVPTAVTMAAARNAAGIPLPAAVAGRRGARVFAEYLDGNGDGVIGEHITDEQDVAHDQRRPAQRKTTVLPSLSSTRRSECQRTARASARASASRPIVARARGS